MTNKDNNKSGMDNVRGTADLISRIVVKNEDAGKTVQELSKSALTISRLINIILIPVDHFNNYFDKQFKKDITEKIQTIPEECLVEPKPYISVPAIQGLALFHEEEELKEMFLNLLASSIDSRTAEKVHPAYAEIIKQLSPKEAELLEDIFSVGMPTIPVSQLRDVASNNSYYTVQNYVLNTIDKSTGEPLCMPEISGMVENLIRLGVIKVDFGLLVGEVPNAYDWVDSRPEIELVKKKNTHKTTNIQSIKGMLSITSLGWSFAESVGLYEKYQKARNQL